MPTLAPVISSSLLVSSNATSGPAACPRVAPLAMITEVVKVGLVPKTAAPAPVSSERTPASWALVVAAKTLRLSDVAGIVAVAFGKVRTPASPAAVKVIVRLTVRVLPSARVRVAPVAGAGRATLLIEGAVGPPSPRGGGGGGGGERGGPG